MTQAPLPPLPKTNFLYLYVLFFLLLGYYVLLLASLAGVVYVLYVMALWVPGVLRYVRSIAALEVLAMPFIAVGTFGIAIVKSVFVRVNGEPAGIPGDVLQHRKLFDLTDEVARKVGAKPLHALYITPDFNASVVEEAALYMPPGLGKRRLYIGFALLCSMTLNEFKSVLAHEFGHFSHKDTFFSRFIYQVHKSYGVLLYEMKQDRWHYVNPIYWILSLYTTFYTLIVAGFSRQKEFRADRFAVEAYGRENFARMMVTLSLEGSFFEELGMDYIFRETAKGHLFSNLYHRIGVFRRHFAQVNAGEMRKILSQALAQETGAFHSHPSVRDRLKAQNIPTANLQVPPLTRMLSSQRLDEQVEPEILPLTRMGSPSAAEELFGVEALRMQQQLTDIETMRLRSLIAAYRAAIMRQT